MEREEEIGLIAYQIWEKEGRPHGRDLEHWLKAEAIWLEHHAQETSSGQPEPVQPAEPRRRHRKAKTIRSPSKGK